MRVKIDHILLLMILLYGINQILFERLLYFNEIISLLGFFYFINFSFTGSFKFRYIKSELYLLVLLFLSLFLAHAALSLVTKTNWYYYLRGLSIVYSVFAFFLGVKLYKSQYDFYHRLRHLIVGWGIFSFSWAKIGLIDRMAFSFWLVLPQRKWGLIQIIVTSILFGLYVLSYTSLTVVITYLVLMSLLYINSYTLFRNLAVLGLLLIVIVFVAAIPSLKLYAINKTLLFGDVLFVYNQHPLFQVDHNTSWRIVFWYRTLVEAFPINLAGIGIGTPMLPYIPGNTTTDLLFDDEYISHVIGAHNTYVSIFIRFGVLSTILFVLIYRKVLREFFMYKRYYFGNRNDLAIFLAFFSISVVGLFNLVIESPTFAALYWISLGFVAAAIHSREQKSKVAKISQSDPSER